MMSNVYGTLVLTHLMAALLGYKLGRMFEGADWARNAKSMFRKEWRGGLFKVTYTEPTHVDDLNRPA